MSSRRVLFVAALTVVVLGSATDLKAQSGQHQAPSQALFDEIAAMDSILFSAFNAGDLGTLETLFAEDLEFYHDQSGLTSYEENMQAFRDLFGRGDGLRRQLVPGSLRVYPVKDYGAIEVGEHTFCHEEGGEKDCGTFPFVQIWRKDGGSWKVSRVVSYGH